MAAMWRRSGTGHGEDEARPLARLAGDGFPADPIDGYSRAAVLGPVAYEADLTALLAGPAGVPPRL
jgi:hypothetical protein